MRHVALDIYDCEIKRIRKQIKETENLLLAERDALSDRLIRVLDRRSQYKKAYTEYQDKLRRSAERIGEF